MFQLSAWAIVYHADKCFAAQQAFLVKLLQAQHFIQFIEGHVREADAVTTKIFDDILVCVEFCPLVKISRMNVLH